MPLKTLLIKPGVNTQYTSTLLQVAAAFCKIAAGSPAAIASRYGGFLRWVIRGIAEQNCLCRSTAEA
jgi:hypothetical protein